MRFYLTETLQVIVVESYLYNCCNGFTPEGMKAAKCVEITTFSKRKLKLAATIFYYDTVSGGR